MNHPDTWQLEQMLDETLSAAEFEALEAHVEDCDSCQATLRALLTERGVPGPVPPSVGYTDILRSGARVGGRYLIRRHLSRGGQGDVYEAWQEDLPRTVAVKMSLSASHGKAAARLAAFREDAAALAQLTHPHIVPIYDYGEHEGRPYFVMEFMQGGSLARKVGHFSDAAGPLPLVSPTTDDPATTAPRRPSPVPPQTGGPLPPEQAARLVEALARAAHYAHGRNILHRDLKPHNVLLAKDGTPKIGDFGLAWRLGAPSGDPLRTATQAGTVSYMAPEAVNGLRDQIGRHTDVYALGAILYEVLAGRPPFCGTEAEVLEQIRTRKPAPPSPLRKARDLSLICLKCLEKQPEHRYANAEVLAEELSRFQKGDLPVQTRWVGRLERIGHWGRRNPGLALAGSLAAVAAAAVLVVSLSLLVVQERALKASKTYEATLARDQGLRLCEQEYVGLGALWLNRALELAPDDAEEVRRTVLMNLDGWGRMLGRLHAPPLPHPGEVHAVAFSPDSKRLVTGSGDGTARLWDVAKGEELMAFRGHRGAVRAVAFSPDGQRLATGGDDGTVRIWDVGSGQQLRQLDGHADGVRTVAFRPADGRTVGSGGADGTARLWDWAASTELCRWKEAAWGPGPLERGVNIVAFSPDGATFLAGGAKGPVFLWDVNTSRPLPRPDTQNAQAVRAAAFRPDGKAYVTAGADRAAQVWETDTGKPAGEAMRHPDQVLAVAFSPDGRTVLTGAFDQVARFWDAGTWQPIGPPLRHRGAIGAVAFSPDGRTVATGGAERAARLWDVSSTGCLGGPFPKNERGTRVFCAAFSHDGQMVLTGGSGPVKEPFLGRVSYLGQVCLWDATSHVRLDPPLEHPRWVGAAVFSPDDQAVLTGCWDGKARLWNLGTRGLPCEFAGHKSAVCAVAFSPDGKRVLTGSLDRTARLWDVDSRKEIAVFPDHQGSVLAVAFGPDGKMILTASADGLVRAWQPDTGKLLRQTGGHQAAVLDAAFSRDGRTALTGGRDQTAFLWETTACQQLGRPLPQSDEVHRVVLSPDGRLALTGGREKTPRFWDVATGIPVGPPLAPVGRALVVAFNHDGTGVGTWSADDQPARLWPAPVPLGAGAERLRLWVEVATATELAADGTPRELDAATWWQRFGRLQELGGPPVP
jgi:WD40 repeat protein